MKVWGTFNHIPVHHARTLFSLFTFNIILHIWNNDKDHLNYQHIPRLLLADEVIFARKFRFFVEI
jgi:hypothetical protein